jgi:hypothetical protein
MNKFKPNRAFRRSYNKIFRHDPFTANMFLMLCEMADENGLFTVPGETDFEHAVYIAKLMDTRFDDPDAKQL